MVCVCIYLKQFQGLWDGRRHSEIQWSVYSCHCGLVFHCDTIRCMDVDRIVQYTRIELFVHSIQLYLSMAKIEIKFRNVKENKFMNIFAVLSLFYDLRTTDHFQFSFKLTATNTGAYFGNFSWGCGASVTI